MHIRRLAAGFSIFAAFAGCADAQGPSWPLLLHPETAFTAATSGTVGFDLGVDGQSSFSGGLTVLRQQSSAEADFIAGVWMDTLEHKVHQREVFVVKPFYAVVVDHLYAPAGAHTVVRQINLPPGAKVNGAAAETALTDGEIFRCQANDKPQDNVRTELKNNALIFTSQTVLPAPVSAILLAGTNLPKVTYVKPANPMIVKCLVKFPNGREDEVAVSWEPRPLHVGGKELRGWAACASKGLEGEKQIEIQP